MNLFLKTIKYAYIFHVLFQMTILVFPVQYAAQGKAYQIGAKDILSLTIYAGGEKQHEADLTVSGRGTINAPFIGMIKAEGLTPSQLEKRITEPLAMDYFVNPKVNISIKEYHSLRYYISGAVKKPGMYEMATEASLLQLIAKAEGTLPGRGNVAYVMRTATNKNMEEHKIKSQTSRAEPIKVDLKRLLDKGDMTANPILKPGDVVYIPLKESLDVAESKIYLEGEVERPGIYDYQPGMTALNACIMAGGFNTFAAPNRTRIIRKKENDIEIIKVNLNDVKKGNIPDIELKPGDRIHVPETWL